MHQHYGDILRRIAEPPLWFDESAVPRFDPFAPNRVANIYAQEAALVWIACQGCGKRFEVAFTNIAASDPLPDGTQCDGAHPMIRDHIRAGTLHYGDPPNMECCAAGASMNSVPRRVLEYWVKPFALGEGLGCDLKSRKGLVILDPRAVHFRRETALEIDITPDWAR